MKHFVYLVFALLFAHEVNAQHSMHDQRTNLIRETGQSQFAALAEVVAVLRDDLTTNWARVDIQALRDHLVDMDNVTTRSLVTVEKKDSSITFTITGYTDIAASIQKMVTAHSPMLEAETGWSVVSATIPTGARMTIAVTSNAEMNQLLGLGFYGLMTIGAHHQGHHIMIARGQSPH